MSDDKLLSVFLYCIQFWLLWALW